VVEDAIFDRSSLREKDSGQNTKLNENPLNTQEFTLDWCLLASLSGASRNTQYRRKSPDFRQKTLVIFNKFQNL